ncbi:MAG: hypothetical protein EXS59_01160 [Candidatus Taylorbacteria bacterium]|nr:hypothetical protein [Candidatus Taylorbacteria bacterium]
MEKNNALTVPMAIVVAAIIIGGAVFMTRGGVPAREISKQPEQPPASIAGGISGRAIGTDEHIQGNPDAQIVMLEYSDLECPFCQVFHKTMKSLLDQYGKSGKLAWAYRHFPLEIHPRSPKESEASECAFEQGGNDKFWAYIDRIFEIKPQNESLDPAQLPKIAEKINLDLKSFQTCLNNGKYEEKVKSDYQDGIASGVNGTPHSVLILKTPVTASVEARLGQINQQILTQLPPGSRNVITLDSTKQKVGISGAFQFVTLKEIIDLLLSGK